ncbi:Clcn7 [Symbiodinium pilosum]|uniref:Clcn7 protein n=1 Tax=Symbiodinium pilosum TaxID=2952 RepID=A0A812YQJ3_SYMPI|nr:Clcn7 [Symbiodinium pilosum]
MASHGDLATFLSRGPVPASVPAALLEGPLVCLQDFAEADLQDLVWQSFHFFNTKFFGNQLFVDEIRFRGSVPGCSEASEGAEAAVLCEFSGDFTAARLWIEFIWPFCRKWPVTRMASVLLHEMVHVSQDSSWARWDSAATAHSSHFLRICADLNQVCQDQDFPFFPNVLTESWVLLGVS